jgi:hypothetical protein
MVQSSPILVGLVGDQARQRIDVQLEDDRLVDADEPVAASSLRARKSL